MEVLLNIENYEEKFCNDRLDFSEAEKKRIKKDAAAALAINLIAQRTRIAKLVKTHDYTINFKDVSGMLPRNKGLSKKPHNYYIQAYHVNDRDTYVIGIQSTGEAKILSHYDF